MSRVTMKAIGILLGLIACQVRMSGADADWVSCIGAEKEMTFVTDPRTWLDAELQCQQSGGHLATMKAQPDYSCATAAVARKSSCSGGNCGLLWTGLNKLNSVNSFHWTGDFNAVEAPTNSGRSTLWVGQGASSTDDNHCVAWLPTFGLSNRQCTATRTYLCERRLSSAVVSAGCQGKVYAYHTISQSYQAAATSCQASGRVLVAATDLMQCVHQLFQDPRLQDAQTLAFWSTCTTPGGNTTQCSTILDTSNVVWNVLLQTTISPHPRPFICRDPDPTTPPTPATSSTATLSKPVSTTASPTTGTLTTTVTTVAYSQTLPVATTQPTGGLSTTSSTTNTRRATTSTVPASSPHQSTSPTSRPFLNPTAPEVTTTPQSSHSAATAQNSVPETNSDVTSPDGSIVVETRIVNGVDESESGPSLGILAGAVVGGAVMFAAMIMIACFIRSRYHGDSRNRLDTASSVEGNHNERPDPCIWVTPSKKRVKGSPGPGVSNGMYNNTITVKNPAERHQYENAELRNGSGQSLGADDSVQYAALQLKKPSLKGHKQAVRGKKEPPTQYAALEHNLDDVVEMCRSASR